MTEQDFSTHHPDDGAVARYLDGIVDAEERDRIEDHLAECDACRAKLGELMHILATRPRRRWMPLVPVLAAAAAVLVILWSGNLNRADHAVTRDPALTETLAPVPLLPIGLVAQIDSIRWSAVPGAARYRLNLFTADGRVLWQAGLTDTVVALPDSVVLAPHATYYWQIKAKTDYGRWVESELAAFTVSEPVRR